MTYNGIIRFILESEKKAIVLQTLQGSTYPDGYRVVNADFSGKVQDDTITYTYIADGEFDDGRDITIS